MKSKWVTWVFLLLVAVAIQLRAQQTEADRKFLEDTKSNAGKGDAIAQYNLGRLYFNGQGLPEDAAEAVKWFREAAKQNLGWSQHALGVCYAFGRGVAKDDEAAVMWYRRAAEQNCADAQYSLGVCYNRGEGVAKDSSEAVKWYRRAAEQNCADAQYNLGVCYNEGKGVAKDSSEAVKWFRKAAEQNLVIAQVSLGLCCVKGEGVAKDATEAVKWFRKAAEQNSAHGQDDLGVCYASGDGVPKDQVEAVKWFRRAAQKNYANAQSNLGNRYVKGEGVPKDYVEAYRWFNLAAAQGDEDAKTKLLETERRMTTGQIAEAQRLTREFVPRQLTESDASISGNIPRLAASGTGFFISADGFLVTNEHVVRDAAQVRLVTGGGFISAKVVKVDAANDLALLKAEGRFAALPVAASRGVKLGGTVATVGFPNIGLQGFAPKLAKGEIASLSGAGDDARYFQISVPVQPGNSGGALVDERGNVVGVVSAKLSASAALKATGALPENVNYAVKSSYLLSFLESVPDVAAKLKEPETKERKFEDVVKSAEQAAVLVLVY